MSSPAAHLHQRLSSSSSALPVLAYSDFDQPTPHMLNALLDACSTYGFFYLDLRDCRCDARGKLAVDLTQEIFDFAPDLFDIPLEEKMRYEVDRYGDVKIGG